MAKVDQHIFLENVPGESIRFTNFAGIERPPFNPAGKRNFSVDILDPALADQLHADGWNVKFSEPDEDGHVYPPRLTVQISFKNPSLQPKVMMEQAGNKVYLNEQTIGDLDNMEILNVKAIELRPYNWEVGGNSGVTAYLDKMRVEVARDIFCD